MKLSVIFVDYHAAELVARAHASFAAELAALGLDAEWLVVDNGEDENGRLRLAELAVRCVPGLGNRGYAAGINAGVAAATGDVLILANPDLELAPGAARHLLDGLRQAPIVGPRFVWDRGGRLLLPAPERWTWVSELARLAARRRAGAARGARRRWRRHVRRQWQATAPLASHELSGALLGVTREVWRQLGPFDEGYRLYFEETDWLARAQQAGIPALFLPAARVLHLYNASASAEPRAADWFARSARRYRERWYGRERADRLEQLAAVASGLPETVPAATLETFATSIVPSAGWWVEVSPDPLGIPAAGELLAEGFDLATWRLPDDVVGRLGAASWFARLVDPSGVERALWLVDTAPIA